MSINTLHTEPRAARLLKWMINRSGSVITAVITLDEPKDEYCLAN